MVLLLLLFGTVGAAAACAFDPFGTCNGDDDDDDDNNDDNIDSDIL